MRTLLLIAVIALATSSALAQTPSQTFLGPLLEKIMNLLEVVSIELADGCCDETLAKNDREHMCAMDAAVEEIFDEIELSEWRSWPVGALPMNRVEKSITPLLVVAAVIFSAPAFAFDFDAPTERLNIVGPRCAQHGNPVFDKWTDEQIEKACEETEALLADIEANGCAGDRLS